MSLKKSLYKPSSTYDDDNDAEWSCSELTNRKFHTQSEEDVDDNNSANDDSDWKSNDRTNRNARSATARTVIKSRKSSISNNKARQAVRKKEGNNKNDGDHSTQMDIVTAISKSRNISIKNSNKKNSLQPPFFEHSDEIFIDEMKLSILSLNQLMMEYEQYQNILSNSSSYSRYTGGKKRSISVDASSREKIRHVDIHSQIGYSCMESFRVKKVYIGKKRFCNKFISNIVTIDKIKRQLHLCIVDDSSHSDVTVVERVIEHSNSIVTSDTIGNTYNSKYTVRDTLSLDSVSQICSIKNTKMEDPLLAYIVSIALHDFVVDPFKTVATGDTTCYGPTSFSNSIANPTKYILLFLSHETYNTITSIFESFHLKIKVMTYRNGTSHFYADMVDEAAHRTISKQFQHEYKERLRINVRKMRRLEKERVEMAVHEDDPYVFFIYPMEKGIKDVVTIHKVDIRKLSDGEYLNDALIDFKLKHLHHSLLDGRLSKRVHIFNCAFYSTLRNVKAGFNSKKAYDATSKWTKKIDIFAYSTILVPINYGMHWSLVAVINLHKYRPCDTDFKPSFLFMDSFNIHDQHEVGNDLAEYLTYEYNTRKRHNNREDLTEVIDVNKVKCNVPLQENSFDCGAFVIKFAEYLLMWLNKALPTDSDADSYDDKCIAFVNGDIIVNSFNQSDVTNERKHLLALTEICNAEWEVEKINRKNAVCSDDDGDADTEYYEICEDNINNTSRSCVVEETVRSDDGSDSEENIMDELIGKARRTSNDNSNKTSIIDTETEVSLSDVFDLPTPISSTTGISFEERCKASALIHERSIESLKS